MVYALSGDSDSSVAGLDSASVLHTRPAIRNVTSIALGVALEQIGTEPLSATGEALYACDARTGAVYGVNIGQSAASVRGLSL